MKLWGRKNKFMLFLLLHLKLQKLQAQNVISALVKMKKALNLYSRIFWEEADTTFTSLLFQCRSIIFFYFVIIVNLFA